MSVMSVLGLEFPSNPGWVMAVWHRAPSGQAQIPVPHREERWAGADSSVSTLEADTDPRTTHPGSRHRPAPPTPPVGSSTAPLPSSGTGTGSRQRQSPPRADPIRAALTGGNCSSMSARGRPPACGEREVERGAGLQEGTAAPESP